MKLSHLLIKMKRYSQIKVFLHHHVNPPAKDHWIAQLTYKKVKNFT